MGEVLPPPEDRADPGALVGADPVADLRQRWSRQWQAGLRLRAEHLPPLPPPEVEGQLTRMVGLLLEAGGLEAAVGDRCRIRTADGGWLEAEVVGFARERLLLMPFGDTAGLKPAARVLRRGEAARVPVGPGLLGRVIDGRGNPLDGRGPLAAAAWVPLAGATINPLRRRPIREPLDVGVRGINTLCTVGRGQRMGLFAGSGVGKSVLLGMMARFTTADVSVVGLIGERGREVKEFIQEILGPEGMRQAVVVAAPADASPLERINGAILATRIAEHFRAEGRDVLLLMDSLTRFAQAIREIALAAGEPPATKGYPPSVFARLPALVERAGTGDHGGGSVTAFYTVLAEGDDTNDPIADAARAILDGHIVLSRAIAERGRYPAIDIGASVSRVMPQIADTAQLQAAMRFRQLSGLYQQSADLIAVGAYRKGTDPRIDEAVALWPRLEQFVSQGMDESSSLAEGLAQLLRLLPVPATAPEGGAASSSGSV